MTLRYFIILIFIGLIVGCIDEPTIEPTPLPYSAVRVGNFADNVDAIQVTIDGEKSYTINKGEVTNYFDLVSGKREFVVTNTANSETIFSSDLDITAYEELNIFFTGYSAPGDEFNNTFSNFNFTEGFVYLFEGPDDPNRVWVRLFNFISDTPDTTSIDVQVEAYSVDGDSSNTTAALEFNEHAGLSLEQGEKNLFLLNEDATDTLSTLAGQALNTGEDYFYFITGPVENPSFYINKRAPLAVRSK